MATKKEKIDDLQKYLPDFTDINVPEAETEDAQFYEYIKEIIAAHSAILELYNNTLYEDSWSDFTISKFDKLMTTYNINKQKIDMLIKNHKWVNKGLQLRFEKAYKEVLAEDNLAFNMAAIRHSLYPIYYKKRKTIINMLNDAIGIIRNTGGKEYVGIFRYFNDICAKVPLYDNRDEKGSVTADKRPVLAHYLLSHYDTYNDVRSHFNASKKYTNDEISIVFRGYVKCREIAYGIFNMLTSIDEINGYSTFKNFIYKYVMGNCEKSVLKRMYYATQDSNTLLAADDYQQELDQYAWNSKGIYEADYSWLFNDSPRRTRDVITKMKAVGKNDNVCKIMSDGMSVYAGVIFYPGDIIEICPTRPISKESLYTKDVRDIVFEVERNKKYVIPFGYCQYYDLASPQFPANCDYMWDPNNNVIVIKATDKIMPKTKLVLNVIQSAVK